VAHYGGDGALISARTFGGSGGYDSAKAVAAFADGSTVLTGSFSGNAVFGLREANETVLSSQGPNDVYVARYAADGSLVWVTRAGGIGIDYGSGIAALPDGSSLVTGRCSSNAMFGPGEPNQATVEPGDAYDEAYFAFVARYDADGHLSWVRSATGGQPSDIAALPGGGAVVVGTYDGHVTFGAGEPGETLLPNGALSDGYMFAARYQMDGSLEWAMSLGTTAVTPRCAALGDGSTLLVGPFLAKYAPDGTLVWSKPSSGSDVAGLPDGSVVVAGGFYGTQTFGAGEPNETTLTAAGLVPLPPYFDAFVARYHADGTLAWVRQATGESIDWAREVVAAADGSLLVAGSLGGTLTFGAGEARETTLSQVGEWFLARYAGNGSLIWAQPVAPHSSIMLNDLAALPDASAYLTGTFSQRAMFGVDEPNATTLLSAGDDDLFLARFAP
jgi:hypothetical protein